LIWQKCLFPYIKVLQKSFKYTALKLPTLIAKIESWKIDDSYLIIEQTNLFWEYIDTNFLVLNDSLKTDLVVPAVVPRVRQKLSHSLRENLLLNTYVLLFYWPLPLFPASGLHSFFLARPDQFSLKHRTICSRGEKVQNWWFFICLTFIRVSLRIPSVMKRRVLHRIIRENVS